MRGNFRTQTARNEESIRRRTRMSEETATKKNVYISLHEGFVRENIQYMDKQTGE